MSDKPQALYVWLVPSEEVLEQPGNWRIRMWDTNPFPEANFALAEAPSPSEAEQPVKFINSGANPVDRTIISREEFDLAMRDAARYRWLRDSDVVDWDAMPLPAGYEHPDSALDSVPKMLDAAIDAAMSASSGDSSEAGGTSES